VIIELVGTGVINGEDAEFGISRMVLEQCLLLVGDVLNPLLLLQYCRQDIRSAGVWILRCHVP
jgi:hypothetical protein